MGAGLAGVPLVGFAAGCAHEAQAACGLPCGARPGVQALALRLIIRASGL